MDPETLAVSFLASGLAHCRAAVVEHGGLISSLFVAGLVGSAGHCVGMCGPFVLAQSVSRLEARPAAEMREFDRLAGAALAPYHLGRATTYVGLGALAAWIAGGAVAVGGLKWVSAGLLILAAAFFAGYAIRRLGWALPGFDAAGEGWWSRRIGPRMRPLFARPIGVRGYLLGVALGFLPCGLLYGALAAAASSGGALSGGLAMAAFAVGTVPALIAVGIAGHVAGTHWRGAAARAMPVLLMINAAALTYMAWRTIA